MADNNIKGRLALITGASGGIGAACARDLAIHGSHLALTYSKNKNALLDVVSEIRALTPETSQLRISVHQVDVSQVDQITRMFDEIRDQHHTHIDILVSNAGYGKRIVNIWDIPLEEFEYTINVNLRASFILVKGIIEGMKAQRWGRIIFISSIAAQGGGINDYAASKGGLSGMMRNLATTLVSFNISVNDVAPALIGDTGMVKSSDVIPGGVETIPLGRLGTPQEVANVVTMYATTGYVTGQTLLLAGGLK